MSRTLEEILAYSRATGMDWDLTADEAGLLRREVERLRDRVAEYEALDWPTCSGEWLSGSGGMRRHGPCVHPATWWQPSEVFAYCDAHIVEHEKPRYWHVSVWLEQAESALSTLQFDQRTLLTQKANLETQLAEERAKREAAERCEGAYRENWKDQCDVAARERARADQAECELAEMRVSRNEMHRRAQAYEGAAMRIQRMREGISRQMDKVRANAYRKMRRLRARFDQEKERAEKAEARNAELQALVDAATLRLSKLVDALGKGRMRPRA